MILIVIFLLTLCQAEVYRTVKTSQGVLTGNILKSREGREYAAFTRVPFAKPPINKLRFMPPEEAGPWNGTLNATLPTPNCTQSLMAQEGQEDCLYLNVYTPNENSSVPVIFYIYGGAFIVGYAGPPEFPAFFMDEDVVFVVPNYRTGIFGFLSLGTKELPGNMGLNDLILALGWVNRHIHHFGGNPDKITVMGLSTGASLAHYMCTSPTSKDLIKGCISISGVGGASWTLQSAWTAQLTAFSFGLKLGCKPWDILPCLQDQPAEKLISEIPLFRPVIDSHGLIPMIPEWPPRYNNFAWLTGHTANEGLLLTGYPGFKTSSIVQNLATLVYYFRYVLKFIGKAGLNNCSICKIYNRFFQNDDFFVGIEKLFAEYAFIYPGLKAAKSHYGPTYFYVFTYRGGPSMYEILFQEKLNISGICHGDDSIYYNNFPEVYKANYLPKGWPSQKDISFSKLYVKMLTNFAREQTPSPGDFKPKWMDFKTNVYMQIDNYGYYRKEYKEMNEIINFWDDIL